MYENMLCGLLDGEQKPHDLLRDGLCICSMCNGSYQAVPGFPDD